MTLESADFAEFYASAKDDCFRAVLASTSDAQAAEDLVAEAFARARAAWPKVSRQSGAASVGGPHRPQHEDCLVAAAPGGDV